MPTKFSIAGAINSLKITFIFWLFVGGSIVALLGGWLTYWTTVSQLEERLSDRGRILGSAINHAAMIAKSFDDIQHVIEQVSKDEPEVRAIVVANRRQDTITLIASTISGTQGTSVDMLPEKHLGSELRHAIDKGEFGAHFEDDRELIQIVPLGHARAGKGSDGMGHGRIRTDIAEK